MLKEQLTENGSAPQADVELRSVAREHLERVRKLKVGVVAYVLGMVLLTAVWALTEYQNADGWPSRLSDQGNTGDWNPWILWVALIWGFLVALDAIKTYAKRPRSEAEVDREVERILRRG